MGTWAAAACRGAVGGEQLRGHQRKQNPLLKHSGGMWLCPVFREIRVLEGEKKTSGLSLQINHEGRHG